MRQHAIKHLRETDRISKDRILFKKVTLDWIKKQKIIVRASTYANYDTIIERHLLPQLGHLPLNHFLPEFLDNFVLQKLSNGRLDGQGGLSPKYVRDIFTVLRSILNLANQQYGVPSSYRLSALPRMDMSDLKVLEETDCKRLEHLTYTSHDWRQQGILLCLYTGLRIGELCALRWTDFNEDKSLLRVRRTVQRIRNVDSPSPKTIVVTTVPKSHKSIRDIPLPPFLSLHFQQVCLNVPPLAFFLTGLQDRGLEPREYQDYFQRFLRQNQFVSINFHMLRHTFATRCIQLGFDPKALSEILGHACVEITLNRYVHANLALKQGYMNRLPPPTPSPEPYPLLRSTCPPRFYTGVLRPGGACGCRQLPWGGHLRFGRRSA